MSQRRKNKEQVQTSILSATRSLLQTHDIEAVTTREIANLAGVSYQTLYNHFPTKAAIVSALLQDQHAHFNRQVDITIKQYDGDILQVLDTLMGQCLEELEGSQGVLWKYLAGVVVQNVQASSSLVLTISHEQFHALLSLAQGMRQLDQQLDLHLMAHALFNMTDYALHRHCLAPSEEKLFLANQRALFELLISPHLRTSLE